MPDLSEGARKLLRHFRDEKIQQLEFELPGEMAALFDDVEDCERAQAELHRLGLIELGPDLPRHIPVPHRIRAAAITLEGERFIARNQL